MSCGECGCDQLTADRASGDLVCTGCGLVQESHMMEDAAEWAQLGRMGGEAREPASVCCLRAEQEMRRAGGGGMALPPSVVEAACAMYRQLHAAANCRAGAYPAMPAVCLYFACKQVSEAKLHFMSSRDKHMKKEAPATLGALSAF